MVKFNGFNENILTFKVAGEIEKGTPVNITDNDTVSAAASGSFVGVVSSSSEDAAAVIMTGFVELPFSGTAPALGLATVAANGDGGITSASTGRTVTVLHVDNNASTVGIIL